MIVNTLTDIHRIYASTLPLQEEEKSPSSLQNIYVSLKQWRLLQAVVDYGSYAKAAEALHISQSTLSYTITKLQDRLGVQLLKIDGRRAILTSVGKSLIARSRYIVKEAIELENFARALAFDQNRSKIEVHLAFDYNFPASLIWQALKTFAARNSHAPDIGLYEVSMLNAEEYIQNNRCDLAISKEMPRGCLAEPLLDIEYIPVAHPDHDLIRFNRPVSEDDLLKHTQIVTTNANCSPEWIGPTTSPCWKTNSFNTALAAVLECHGYAWFPHHKVLGLLEAGQIRKVPLKNNSSRKLMMYLIHNCTSPFYCISHSFIEVLREITRQHVKLH